MVKFTITAISDGDQRPDNQTTIGDIAKMKRLSETFTLEEAIRETKIGKYQNILTFLTAMCVFGTAIENLNISFIMPYVKCDLKLTTEEQGLLSAISYLGIVFTSHFWGFLADTWGRHKVLQTAAIGAFIFSFLSAFATNFISMILLRFTSGAFVAGLASAGYSYVSEFHTSESAARAAAYVSIALSGVWLVMSPLALLIIPMDWSFSFYSLEYKPWRFFITCLSFVNLFNAIAISFVPESPKFLLAMNRKNDAIRVLQRIYAVNTGNPKEEYPVKSIESVTLMGNSLSDVKGICGLLNLIVKQTKPIFQPPLFSQTWKISFIIFVMFAIGHGIFMWFPDFLLQLLSYDGAPKTLCGIVASKTAVNSTDQACDIDNKDLFPFQIMFVVGICFAVLATLSTFYLKKINPKMLVCGWLCVSAVACLLLNILTDVYSSVLSFVIFLSVNCSSNIIMAVAVNVFPTNYRGVATAFILMFGRVGGLSGSSIVGLMLNMNCSLIFYISSGVIITCALIFKMTNLKPQ